MLIIGKNIITKFAKKHNLTRKPLAAWMKIVDAANWKNAADIKACFNSVDKVGAYYVFNIAGNNCRLVALVVISHGVVQIDRIMTHAEYDRWNKKK